MNIEKIFSAPVLIVLNLAIIIATESTGSLFMDYGIIHFIALFFLLLAVSRIFVHYNTFDRFLKPLIFGAVLAMIIFSYSHLSEYYSFSILQHYPDDLYVDVTNFYMTAMLLVATTAQYFIYKRDRSYALTTVSIVALLCSIVFTAFGLMGKMSIPLDADEISVYLYSGAVLVVSLFSINRMFRIGKAVSIMRSFATYFVIAFSLIALSALHYSLYEVITHFGISEMQVVYSSHFVFYIALSLIFLAFPKLAKLGGIYASLK